MIRTCPVCKLTYCPDEPEDRMLHRQRHRPFIEGLNPKPMKSLPPNSIVEVRGDWPVDDVRPSPAWMNRQMYIRARAFQREFKYDFTQWCSAGENDSTARGILFVDEQKRIVGAAAFRWRSYLDAPSEWAMQWIWFSPKYRRQGYLARHWSQLRRMYGDFRIEAPVSDAMQAFVRKQGDDKLLL